MTRTRITFPLVISIMMVGTAMAQTPPAPPASTSQRHFDITEFRVDGNTVLTEMEIDRAVYGFLGPDKTAADVEKARAALEAAYQAKGYPTVSAEVPRQRVEDGVVVLKITERTVGRVRVKGSQYHDLADIKAAAPSLKSGKVPHMPDVTHDIVGLNQWPDRAVTPALRAGVAPDTVDVDLDVKDEFPGHATLELNNRQSADTTGLRLSGSLSYNNLWQRGDSATVSFQLAPQQPSDAEVFSGSYLFHIPDSDLSLLFSYLHSNSNVTTVGSTDVIGKGDVAGLRLLVPLGFGEGFIHTLSLGFDYKHFDDDIALGASRTEAPVTYFPFTAAYQANWTSQHAQTNFLASLVFTLSGPGSSPAAFDFARFDASPSFAYLRTDLSRTQTLPDDIQLYGRLTGQLTGQPLISNEQFSLGGLDSVRGYLESEVLGDYGGALQTEIRTPALAGIDWLSLDELRGLVFFDAGTAVLHDPLPQQKPSYVLASAGFGARIHLFRQLNGEVLLAFPLDDGTTTKAGNPRALFRVYGDF